MPQSTQDQPAQEPTTGEALAEERVGKGSKVYLIKASRPHVLLAYLSKPRPAALPPCEVVTTTCVKLHEFPCGLVLDLQNYVPTKKDAPNLFEHRKRQKNNKPRNNSQRLDTISEIISDFPRKNLALPGVSQHHHDDFQCSDMASDIFDFQKLGSVISSELIRGIFDKVSKEKLGTFTILATPDLDCPVFTLPKELAASLTCELPFSESVECTPSLPLFMPSQLPFNLYWNVDPSNDEEPKLRVRTLLEKHIPPRKELQLTPRILQLEKQHQQFQQLQQLLQQLQQLQQPQKPQQPQQRLQQLKRQVLQQLKQQYEQRELLEQQAQQLTEDPEQIQQQLDHPEHFKPQIQQLEQARQPSEILEQLHVHLQWQLLQLLQQHYQQELEQCQQEQRKQQLKENLREIKPPRVPHSLPYLQQLREQYQQEVLQQLRQFQERETSIIIHEYELLKKTAVNVGDKRKADFLAAILLKLLHRYGSKYHVELESSNEVFTQAIKLTLSPTVSHQGRQRMLRRNVFRLDASSSAWSIDFNPLVSTDVGHFPIALAVHKVPAEVRFQPNRHNMAITHCVKLFMCPEGLLLDLDDYAPTFEYSRSNHVQTNQNDKQEVRVELPEELFMAIWGVQRYWGYGHCFNIVSSLSQLPQLPRQPASERFVMDPVKKHHLPHGFEVTRLEYTRVQGRQENWAFSGEVKRKQRLTFKFTGFFFWWGDRFWLNSLQLYPEDHPGLDKSSPWAREDRALCITAIMQELQQKPPTHNGAKQTWSIYWNSEESGRYPEEFRYDAPALGRYSLTELEQRVEWKGLPHTAKQVNMRRPYTWQMNFQQK